MRFYIALLFVTVAVFTVWGEDKEQSEEQIKAKVTECFKKCNITKTDVENAKTKEVDMTTENNKCRATCNLKCLGVVSEDGQINESLADLIITKIGERLKINDTQPAKNAIKECAEKMKSMKAVNCDVGGCIAKGMKDEWPKYMPQ